MPIVAGRCFIQADKTEIVTWLDHTYPTSEPLKFLSLSLSPVPQTLWTNDRKQQQKHKSVLYFTFVYRLYHLGRRRKKETFVCCTLECLGRRDVIQR